MTRTVLLVVSIVSLAACGRMDPVVQEHTGSAATMLRATPDSVAGGSNHYNVWPTGDPGLDVSNVQWAVDHANAGGVVSLKATNKFTGAPMAFEFGAGGSVEVTSSVSIRGEVDDTGSPLATIHGGYRTFHCDDPSVTLAISTLRFDGARRAAIHVKRSAAATITGNVMRNLLPAKEIGYPNPVQLATPPLAYNPLPYYAASGIEMGSLVCEHPDPQPPNVCLDEPNQLGSVDISDNWIDLGIHDADGHLLDPAIVYPNAKPDGTPLEDTSFSGILLVDARAIARISGNTIQNTNRRAIHPLDVFGSTEIVGNTIVMAPFSSAAPGQPSSGGTGKRNFGIFPFNGHRNVAAASDGAVHTILRNTVYLASDLGVDGPHGNAIIALNAVNGTVISDNTVVYVAGARNAIAIAGNNSSVRFAKALNTRIDHNTIDASSHPLDTSSTPAHILVSQANSTTVDTNTYLGGTLPRFVILGVGTNVIDADHPNTVVDAYCGPPSDPQNHPKISFVNLASCTQP